MTSNTPAPDAPEIIQSEEQERSSGIKELVIVAAIAAAFAIFKPDLFKTVAVFVATLGVLVFVHEWGHFQFARWAGLKVNRFALGFPPFIYNKRYKGINYSLGALPIGGMVDIAGLGSEEEMVADVRGKGTAPVRNTSRPRGEKQFQDVHLGWRFLTLFAGPLMNFLLAIALFVGVYSIAGIPDATIKARVESVTPDYPAIKAGIKEGDDIVAFGSKKTPTLESLVTAIHENKAKASTITVLRDGKNITFPITPQIRDINNNGKPLPSIGIGFDQEAISSFKYQKVSPADAVRYGFLESAGVSMSILDTVRKAVTGQLAAHEKKAIGGPIKIARVMNVAADFGWPVLFRVAAMLSVNLGLLNLMPFPALDGGRIMFLGYELIMRRPVDPRKEGIVHAAGMVVLLAFMLFITLRDVIG
ncbi:RIP metalloprotease [bacterium]|nr:MAG: RIP metalloprotease [bacterium]